MKSRNRRSGKVICFVKMALQNIDPDLVERIEIVKGPRSSLYGSEAIGGVIQIFTRKHRAGTGVNASATVGDYQTRKAVVNGSITNRNWKAGLTLSRFVTDGFPAHTALTANTGSRNSSVNAFIATQIAGLDTELRTWHSQGNTQYYNFAPTPVSQDSLNATSALTLKRVFNNRATSVLRIGEARDFIDQNQSADFAHTRRLSADWQNDVQLGDHGLVTAGLYASKQYTNADSFGTSFSEVINDNAAYAQYHHSNGQVQYLLGGRYTQNSAYGGQATGNLSYGYRLSKKTNIFAALGSGFRAPDSTDKFGFGGNPTLKPETSQNLELGFRYNIDRKSSLKSAAFYNRISNLIVFDTGSSLNQNIDLAVIPGFEVEYKNSNQRIEFRFAGILQDPVNVTSGKQLARRSRQSLTMSATYNRPAYQIGFDLLASGDRPDSDFSSVVNPAYALVNLHGRYRFSRRWQLQGRVENLFATDYVLANGYNTPGRSFFLQLRYQGSITGEES